MVALCNQERSSDTSVVESGLDVDDACSPTRKSSLVFPRLAPLHEEVILLFH